MSIGRLLLIIVAGLILSLARPPMAAAHAIERATSGEQHAGLAGERFSTVGPIRTAALADVAIKQIAPVIVSDTAILDRTALIGRIFVALGAFLTLVSAARMLVL